MSAIVPIVPACEYHERFEGRQRECGLPAHYRGVKAPKLHYCRAHGDFIVRHVWLQLLDGTRLAAPVKQPRRY
jgi:hypothetical protein